MPKVQASSRVILQRWTAEGVKRGLTSSFSPYACFQDLAAWGLVGFSRPGGDEEDREWLIPFLVLYWLWRDFPELGGSRADPLGGLGKQGCGGLLSGSSGAGGGGDSDGCGGRVPRSCPGLCHRDGCCWGLATHAKLVHS